MTRRLVTALDIEAPDFAAGRGSFRPWEEFVKKIIAKKPVKRKKPASFTLGRYDSAYIVRKGGEQLILPKQKDSDPPCKSAMVILAAVTILHDPEMKPIVQKLIDTCMERIVKEGR